MSWLIEWKAISAQIEGLLEASRFYIDSLLPANQAIGKARDVYKAGENELLPLMEKIRERLGGFREAHKQSIPVKAAECLDATLNRIQSVSYLGVADAFQKVHVMVTLLVSFRAEFEYHLSDTAAVAKRLSERAFSHLQRSIVVDRELREKWIAAFRAGELACEKLGAVHLLLHGIWAFKVNAAGERTDLVFDEPVRDFSSIERVAESLVLTEWKCVRSPAKTEVIATDARKQAARYTVGALGGLVELIRYRFIVLVSENTLKLPENHSENEVEYRHVNVAVNPKPPSKG